MQLKTKTFLLFLIFVVTVIAQNPGDNVFAGVKVHSIYIQLDQPNYWDSLTYYYSLGTEQYMVGRVTVNGVVYDTIGVRLKGNSSYSHPNNKKSFRVSFGEFINQRWDGLKSVHLNNCWGDPTFMREKLFLDFCRDAGIRAPRSNYAEVYLNGELWGFYSLVEHVDKRLLSNQFDDNNGNLYKAVDGIGATSQFVSDLLWYGNDPASYQLRYELKTDEPINPWGDLIRMLDSLNNSSNPSAAIKGVFNIDEYYKVLAADIFFANLDSYINSGRNFHLYNLPTTNKFNWIIWDTGLSFGGYVGGVTNFETLSLLYVSNGAQRPLLSKIYSTPDLRNDYLKTACRLHKIHFKASKLLPKIDTIANFIRPYVYADQKKMYTSQQFELNINSDITVAGGTGNVRRPGLKSFVSLREANIQTQLSNYGVNCDITVSPGDIVINEFMAKNDSIPDPAGEPEDWIEIYNNTNEQISLAGMYLSDSFAQPLKWQFPENTVIEPNGFLVIWADEDTGQAGLHCNFKLAIEGEQIILSNIDQSLLDSVTYGQQTSNISMGRIPNGTGSFVFCQPTLGAPNVSPLNILYGEVVINEFAADNDSIPDPVGEKDDWIELYNNTNRSIDLSGIYLSDNFNNRVKWKFPESTIIEPRGYLIVWADNDTTQPGLHAAFALSASGERIIMSNKDLSVIDSVTFGPQVKNMSMARIPNGTGFFVMGVPTFNGPNSPVSVRLFGNGIVSDYKLNQNYPNPFNPRTVISWYLPNDAHVKIELYNIMGEKIALLIDEFQKSGSYDYTLSADEFGLGSGVYLYRLVSGNNSLINKMLYLK